jgi:DNA-3-methyladenine glycosylase I
MRFPALRAVAAPYPRGMLMSPDAPTLTTMTLLTGSDGRTRCGWVGSSPEYVKYHDDEWGVPLHGDRSIWQKITLEAFQSGLSWLTILKRREGFRSAFAGFDPEVVAAYGEADFDRLMNDVGIIRNRLKIQATIDNAKALVALQAAEGDGALDALVWSFAPEPRPEADRPREYTDLDASTPESKALSKALKAKGFRFTGPTTMYALMQSGGLVDDHLRGCFRAAS